ncbi:MAG: PDZ domain-containing protein [Armatimonadetes bacterium]|nr:PDZ domain-containing protein [Armatimonadota bacterium]
MKKILFCSLFPNSVWEYNALRKRTFVTSKKKILIILLFLSISIYAFASDLLEEINDLYLNQEISNHSLFILLSEWNNFQQPDSTGIFLKKENAINDTLIAPYYIHIPLNYDPSKPAPLLVYLHGGVGRKDFVEEFDEYTQKVIALFPQEVRDEWFFLFPQGNQNTMWWDLVGMENIKTQIKNIKKNYNIDDDNIYMTGFSDGGSASFHFALTDPNLFAAFYPLNGFIAVGSRVTQNPAYLPNLQNRHSRAINTDEDGLYPSADMRLLMELSLQAGADLLYKEYWGIGHTFDYAEEDIPIMVEDMKNHVRDIFRSDIYWESSIPEFNKCDWLEITELDTLETPEEWHKEYNIKMENKRIQFGFYHDETFEGKGVKVGNIIEGSTADSMGLKKDDIVIRMDGKDVENIEKLSELKSFKKRGDTVSLTVLRDKKEVKLFGQFPEVEFYDAFILNKPSGAVKVKYWGNHFEIETSRVDELAIYIHPDMVNLKIPVTVNINDEEVFNDLIAIDREFMVENFKTNFDRKALWVNRIVLKL